MSKRKKFSELFFSQTKDFLDLFLPRQAGRSGETVKAYKASLNCFFTYITKECGVNAADFGFSDCTYNFMLGYSQYLQEKRHLSNSSVNQRLAAVKSYLKYVSDGDAALAQVYLCAKKLPLLKTERIQRPVIEKEDLRLLLESPENTKTGNRDRLILILLFDLAIRVSELLDITIGDISLDASSPSILIHGKGKKQRAVLPSPGTVGHLKEYLKVFHGTEARPESFLFYTIIHGRTNRMSVRNVERIVDKYAKIVSSKSDSMPKSCYPHMMRRTRATGLYQDGVPIEMVSVILGHSNTETTKIYAAPSVEQLRENMQRAQPEDTSVEKLWEGKEDDVRKIFGLA